MVISNCQQNFILYKIKNKEGYYKIGLTKKQISGRGAHAFPNANKKSWGKTVKKTKMRSKQSPNGEI